jgi:hypothetical protein
MNYEDRIGQRSVYVEILEFNVWTELDWVLTGWFGFMFDPTLYGFNAIWTQKIDNNMIFGYWYDEKYLFLSFF